MSINLSSDISIWPALQLTQKLLEREVCLFVCLSFYLSVFLFVCFWKQMSINFIERYFYLTCFATYAKAFGKRGVLVRLFVLLSFCLSVCLLLEANVHQFYQAIFLFVLLCNLRKSFWKERCVLSVCLSVCLFVCLSACLSFWLSLSDFIFLY